MRKKNISEYDLVGGIQLMFIENFNKKYCPGVILTLGCIFFVFVKTNLIFTSACISEIGLRAVDGKRFLKSNASSSLRTYFNMLEQM